MPVCHFPHLERNWNGALKNLVEFLCSPIKMNFFEDVKYY